MEQTWVRDARPFPTIPSPQYYSTTLFHIDEPDQALRWLDKIGGDNVRSLTKLRLWVGAVYHDDSLVFGKGDKRVWRTLFSRLATMTHIRELVVSWDAELSMGHPGGGADLGLVRRLGRMDFLERLTIGGYFAKEWPGYLGDRVMDLRIDDWDGQGMAEYQKRVTDLSP
ncbi:hypothetical protein LTR36_011005 [Oleoguttula mirabilis]|uniref:Uncharacterized protein n=1 Tax=Oleoguttula mirabilis TaxID=1507867 RepID=A0AAV9J3E9_9PEZI|nr:hypothetical protein LTR36_011005 [Oleoguttula mirabilis]